MSRVSPIPTSTNTTTVTTATTIFQDMGERAGGRSAELSAVIVTPRFGSFASGLGYPLYGISLVRSVVGIRPGKYGRRLPPKPDSAGGHMSEALETLDLLKDGLPGAGAGPRRVVIIGAGMAG